MCVVELIAMKRDAIEKVIPAYWMLSLVLADTFQETFHPELSSRIAGAITRAIELADLGAKHLNGWIILMHKGRKLNERLHVFVDSVFLTSLQVDESIWFVAHCPVFNRVE